MNPETMNKILVGAAVGGAAGLGVVVGWNLAEKKYQAIADDEIARFKEEYHNDSRKIAAENEAQKAEMIQYVKEDVSKTVQIFDNEGYGNANPAQSDVDTVAQVESQRLSQSTFPDDAAPEWDQAAEVLQREQNGPDEPYILSVSEYMEGLDGQTQVTLTYYEEDEVLADVKDEAVPNGDNLIGDGNLEFGRGSDDPNIVYIRNEAINLDFEIIRSKGSYAREVYGIQDIKHSDDRRRSRRMRDD